MAPENITVEISLPRCTEGVCDLNFHRMTYEGQFLYYLWLSSTRSACLPARQPARLPASVAVLRCAVLCCAVLCSATLYRPQFSWSCPYRYLHLGGVRSSNSCISKPSLFPIWLEGQFYSSFSVEAALSHAVVILAQVTFSSWWPTISASEAEQWAELYVYPGYIRFYLQFTSAGQLLQLSIPGIMDRHSAAFKG